MQWWDQDAFEPTTTMRLARPSQTTTAPDRLQQQWRRAKIGKFGHVEGWDYEWRDVPLEILDGEIGDRK